MSTAEWLCNSEKVRRTNMENRVVITGMGAVTPIGNTADEFWNNAKQGKLGIDTIKSIDTEGLEVKVAGEVKDLDLTKFLDKKECED